MISRRRDGLAAARTKAGLTQEDLAVELGVDRSTVIRWERGESAPRVRMRVELAAALGLTRAELDALLVPVPAGGTVAAGAWSALVAGPSGPGGSRTGMLAALTTALTSYQPPATVEPLSDCDLAGAVAGMRRDYQATRYAAVARLLPVLLPQLAAAEDTATEPGLVRAWTADAYQVASGLALKHNATSLATLAADRAMRAATACGDPVVIGAAARAVAHALMRSGHQAAAAALATSEAGRLDVEGGTAARAVAGALLLRGAVAAADALDRDLSSELLAAAGEAAAALPAGANSHGTGFNAINVEVHRVNRAVVLGDAGTALTVARRIDLDAILLVERRVSLIIDVARAYTQWGRYEAALDALHLAERVAPEEVQARQVVADTVDTIRRAGPRSVRASADAYAQRLAHV